MNLFPSREIGGAQWRIINRPRDGSRAMREILGRVTLYTKRR